MKHLKKSLISLLVLMLAICQIGCGAPSDEAHSPEEGKIESASSKPGVDPSGAEVKIPDEINSVVVLSPAIAETLIALGRGDKITGCDLQSAESDGIPSGIPAFDIQQPDMEQLAALKPDVLFVSNMTLYDQANPYEQLIEMGICVLCVPAANSIKDIESDIDFIAKAVGKPEEGKALISDMQAELDKVAAIGKSITKRKKVYFEIAAAPNMYSFGRGVFLNEMLELAGAENIFADKEGWLPVEGEAIASANPDVILTSVSYLDDPVGEILSRKAWEGVKAVSGKAVYHIDNKSSSLPNQNIVKALKQIARAVYPEFYED